MTRPERVSSIQALAWLNAIAEDDSGDESKGENVCEGLDLGSSSFEGYPLQVRHKQDWGRGFIFLLPQVAALPESDPGSGVIKPASSFVIQNRQTSCSMWCPMYRARC